MAEPRSIIGGLDEPGRPEVVMLQVPAGRCSGTLIAPEVVLTAAHCVAGQVLDGRTSAGAVLFGASANDPDATAVGIRDMAMHRRYNINQLGIGLPFDIAAVRLEEPAPEGVRPAVFNDLALDPEEFEGEQMLAIGFGNDDGQNNTGSGTKRRVFLPISRVLGNRIRYGNDTVNTCQGDSGGPGFLTVDGLERVVGIVSTGPAGCGGTSTMNRVDTYVDDFLYQVVDAWSGPCANDGECVAECPRTPDPDCDPCGFNGVCGDDCPNGDFDCPIVGFSADACETDQDCESRFCLEAPEDPRVKYCSDTCDLGAEATDECESPLTTCVEAAGSSGAGECRFAGTTPGVQGADCSTGAECRSGICDLDNNLCAEPCDSSDECGEGFECRGLDGASGDVCRVPASGGCAVAQNRGSGAGWGVGLLVAVVLVQRRRRGPRSWANRG